jgi:Cu(I)/Ag(I) efflux system membrane protein CusA/SilA
MDLAELRSRQDFFVKYALQSVDGVAEVASIGGYVRQYQVDVDPDELRFHNITLSSVIAAVKASNIDVGAKTVEQGGMEFIVRGKGFIGSGKTEAETIEQIEDTVVVTRDGVPITVGQLANVQTGPAFRRGALDFNGSEAVGGVVVMRYGENPRAVIDRLKTKIASLQSDLDGIKTVGVYDRTQLIDETITTLTTALAEETLITIVVMVLFLLHIRASLIIAVTLPTAVLMSFIAMKLFNVDANIMSLAGIAIAIGTMVDMGIIVLENVYEGLAAWEAEAESGDQSPESGAAARLKVIRDSAAEVIPAVMTAVSTTVVSFLPVFFLTGRDHRLFSPLAWTKTFALVSSLIVAVTVVPMLCRVLLSSNNSKRFGRIWSSTAIAVATPVLCSVVWGKQVAAWTGWSIPVVALLSATAGILLGWWMSRERVRSMEDNPVSRFVRWLYGGRLRFALNHKLLSLSFPAMIFVVGLGAWIGLPTVLQPVENSPDPLAGNSTTYPDMSTRSTSSRGCKLTTGSHWTKAAGSTCPACIRPPASIRPWKSCRLRMP